MASGDDSLRYEKAHQRIIREKAANSNGDLFGRWWEDIDTDIKKAVVREIDYRTAQKIILEYEWLGTMAGGYITSYGIYWQGCCGGVIVFGHPTVMSLKSSVAGEKYQDKVIQLQRGACVHWAHPHAASFLISRGLKYIGQKGYKIVIAYSDPDAGEVGTVYQATNWLYCGKTIGGYRYFDECGDEITGQVGKIKDRNITTSPRTPKGRYVYILGSKKERKEIRRVLRWPVEPYIKRQLIKKPPD